MHLQRSTYALRRVMTEPRYRIEEYTTVGWELADEKSTNLTKEEAKEMYDVLIHHEGLNPNRVRVQREA